MEPRNYEYEQEQALTHEIAGQVDYAIKKKYRWISESGKNTCEKCKSLDAKVFELKDLPKRPHPNCKCRVEEISIVEGSVAKLYGYRDEKFNLEIDAKEILGDLNVIREKMHEELDNVGYSEIIDKKEKLLSDIQSLEIEVNRYIDCLSELGRHSGEDIFQQKSFELIHLSARRKELFDQAEYLRLKALQLKWDEQVESNKAWGEDAAAIWKLASSKFTEGLDYIKKNGYLLSSINELNNEELETAIRKKLEKQIKKSDAKVLVLNENSSLANHLSKDLEFVDFIRKNLSKLKSNKKIPDDSLHFTILEKYRASSFNAHFALHRCDIKNIYLDENDILHATILDTVDYNSKEKEVEELRELQEAGFLENYVIMINIAEPLLTYEHYLYDGLEPYFYVNMKQ